MLTVATFELVVTVLAVGELLLFTGIVAPRFQWANFTANAWPNGWSGALASIPFAIWFYLAIEGVANAAEEAKNPRRDVAIGFGGAMTYGQTVGLSHDPQFNGNWEALRWGMLGLAVIGGIWAGFAGVLLGMGLGAKRYGALEIALLWILLIGLYFLGLYLLNEPFDPALRRLPRIYFSGDWYWPPDNEALRPRPGCWGRLLFALRGRWG